MSKFGYTYCLVKYVHNPAAGEMLNIGVLLFSDVAKQIVGKFEIHFDRLSSAFANFDGDHYRFVIRNLEHSISQLNDRFNPSLFQREFEDIKEIFRLLVPDLGLSIQFGNVLAGITNNLEDEAGHIFYRLITSQTPQREKKSRSDEEVWTIFNKPLSQRQVTKYLEPKHFTSNEYDLKFEHTFKNEKHHILDPVTMDYAQAESIQNRAIKILGQATTLEGNPEIGKLYLLLGAPKNTSHRNAYTKAKNLLNKIPIDKEIIEENEAEDFAKEITSYMKEHGVFKSE
ncbi:MAG: DUF3037 domain-containing protein [Acidobacteriota bacterium]|nr:DUF3037 domain-containing protein [Acidobacteriota bacterium]